MMHRLLLTGCVGLILMAGGSLPAQAQNNNDDEPRVRPGAKFTQLLNTDALVDNYARFLARKYNLTDEQAEYTQTLLHQKAETFLSQNRDELYTLVDRLFEVRGGGDMDPAELTQWGQRVTPIFERAKTLIVDGNNEWRKILNDDQKKIHDEDVRLMNESFRTTEEQLHRIASGDMTVDEFRRGPNRRGEHPPPPPVRQTPPPNHIRPQPAQPTPSERPQVRMEPRPPVPMRPTPVAPPEAVQPATDVPPDGPTQEELDAKRRELDQAEENAADAAERKRIEQERAIIEARARMHEQGGTAPPAGEAIPPQPEQPADEGQDQPPPPDAGQPEPQPAPMPERPLPRGAKGSHSSSNFETEWDAYVHDFIDRYKLDDDQQQRALSILKDCKEQGTRIMQSRREQLRKLDEETAGGAPGGAAAGESKGGEDAKARLKHATDAAARREKLLAPLNDIFERQLKPRLDRLPTRAQRKEAEAAAPKTNSNRPPKAGKSGPSKEGGSHVKSATERKRP